MFKRKLGIFKLFISAFQIYQDNKENKVDYNPQPGLASFNLYRDQHQLDESQSPFRDNMGVSKTMNTTQKRFKFPLLRVFSKCISSHLDCNNI